MIERLLILAAALAAMPVAIACGVCIDDKVAAVYDYAQVRQAQAKGQVVVFCELAGPRDAGALTQRAGRAARGLHGVEPGSVRAANDLPVLSFSLDPGAQSPAAAIADLRRRLRPDHVTPTLLKVLPPQ